MLVRVFLALLALSLVANASLFSNQQNSDISKHSRLARRVSSNKDHPLLKKRCKTREKPSLLSSVRPAETATEVKAVASTKAAPMKAISTKAASVKATSSKKPVSTSVHHTTSAAKPVSSSATKSNPVAALVSGLLQVTSPVCGPSGATKDITTSSGPNGDENFLNCGINGAGWQPPAVSMSQLIVVDLSDAIKDPNTPFKPCAPYISLLNKYADMNGIPPIMLASIAMQESTCNPSAVGGGGEQGLMQISKDKCVGAPGGNCQDPDFNIKTGAEFFAQTLKSDNGNVLLTVGRYNGWQEKMTVAQATAAANSSCCRCQNNLDYLFQLLNGWAQNIDPREHHMGIYQNLKNCP